MSNKTCRVNSHWILDSNQDDDDDDDDDACPSALTWTGIFIPTFPFSSQPNHDDPLFKSLFDVILRADIIYESQHALWIKSCLTKLLRKPSSTIPSDISSTLHLVIHLRATHVVESNTNEQVFSLNNHIRHGNTAKEIIICGAAVEKERMSNMHITRTVGGACLETSYIHTCTNNTTKNTEK